MRRLFYKRRAVFIPLAIIAFAGFIALTGYVVMSLWNLLLPGILHVGTITFWQAIGIFVLCKILFGFGRGGHGPGNWKRRRMEERFKSMTPEEKEKFKEQMQRRCDWDRGDNKAWEGGRGNYHSETPSAAE